MTERPKLPDDQDTWKTNAGVQVIFEGKKYHLKYKGNIYRIFQ